VGSIPTPGTITRRWLVLAPQVVLRRSAVAQGARPSGTIQAVTLFLSIYAWAATSLVLGGDPMVAHGGLVVTVAAMMSGALVSTMSVVAAILRWSRSDDITLRLLWRDVAAALIVYGTLCMFPAGDIV
jgi:hypothetical protein